MKISYNWLSEYLSMKLAPEKVAEALTMSIAEVEDVRDLAGQLDKCVIGVVKKVEKHPNADKLVLATVGVGKNTTKRVVCGGTNVTKGMKVAFAYVGSMVNWHGEGDWQELLPATIRGQKSEGMICSSEELGLADVIQHGEHEIADLSHINAPAGTPLAKALGRDDVVFEIDNKSLTHRADLFSHVGLAREVAAVTTATFKERKLKTAKGSGKTPLKIEIKAPNFCRRYLGAVLKVKVGSSPEWLRARLEAVGQRSINNVVDVTNYVMFEYGQPLHAFDAKHVANNHIIVRKAKAGETFITLDGEKRTLDASMLMIADPKKATAIAGIMGGENSEVTKSTKEIIVESANFEPVNVRQTSQKLGLRTEGLVRWEKGLTTVLSEQGFRRAIELFQEVAGATIVSNIVDEHPKKEKPVTISLRQHYVNDFIGVDIPAKDVEATLKALECEIEKTKDGWSVTPPIPRRDLKIEEDLVEEVARVYGYDKIPQRPLEGTLALQQKDWAKHWEFEAVRTCAELQFTEVYNNTFYGDAEIEKTGLFARHIELENSQSEELKYLRTTLLPGLLLNLEKNSRGNSNLKFVECGHVFPSDGEEHTVLAGVITGKNAHVFFDAKGALEAVLNHLSVRANYIRYEDLKDADVNAPFVTPEKGLAVLVRGKFVGVVGVVPASLRRTYHIDPHVGFFTLAMPAVTAAAGDRTAFESLPNFPGVFLDLAFEVSDGVAYEILEKAIRNNGQPLLASVELFDVYEGSQITKAHRGLAFHLVYQAPDRTLKLKEAQNIHQKIIQTLKNEFHITLRGENN